MYDLVGGTVVVTSRAAVDTLATYNISVIHIDDVPELFLELDQRIENTINYLNGNAKVVFVYETFVFKKIKLTAPTIMLSHGVPLKDYWVDWKIKTVIQNYTYIATLGAFMKQQLTERGVPESMFIDIGLSRNDLIINRQAKYSRREFLKLLPNYKGQSIVSYMPTYWGATSVFDTGIEIFSNISDNYYLIFKPHPQTPLETIEKYHQIIAQKQHTHYISEEKADLLSLYKYTDVIIGDMSSVVADAILADKPLVFAYGGNENQQDKRLYHPIREVQTTSFSISAGQGDCIDLVVDAARHEKHIRKKAYRSVAERLFFNLDGNSRNSLAELIIDKFDVS
jgi:CDP-glycerol glycerophosphotransferase (TagB/SpsB family)